MDLPSQSLLVYMGPQTWVLWGVSDQLEQGELEIACPYFPTLCPASLLLRALLQITFWLLSGETGGQNWELQVGFFPLWQVPIPGGVDVVSSGARVWSVMRCLLKWRPKIGTWRK